MFPSNACAQKGEEVVICRFGSAFSTLTVMLLEADIHAKIQDEMKKLDTEGSLREPRFLVSERVCFKNNLGVWTRANIAAICESDSIESVYVDIVLEDTLETLRRVDGRALVSLPAALRGLKNATLFFIERLEPYRYTIGPKGSAGLQGAQVSADALNKAWTVTPAGTRLTKRYPVTHPLAKRTRLEVATVFMTQCLSLRSYITSFLNDHEISPFSQETMVLSQHPWFKLGSSVLCPLTSERELCEVISLRKIDAKTLEVGLRLCSYLDTGLLKKVVSCFVKNEPSPMNGPSVVSVRKDCTKQSSPQRGVMLEDGQVLGIDSLELFKPGSVEIRMLPFSAAQMLPHTGLFIHWDASISSRTPCLGDMIFVWNLVEDRNTLFRFTYEDVSFMDGPTNINYHPSTRLPAAGDIAEEVKAKKKTQKKKPKPSKKMTIADWYGLSEDLQHVFKTSPSTDSHPTLDTLLAQYGESVSASDL